MRDKQKDIRFKLDVEKIMALLSGKIVKLKFENTPLVIIEPPQGKISMSYEEFLELEMLASYAREPYKLMELLEKIKDTQNELIEAL